MADKKEEIQKNLIKKAFERGEATSIENGEVQIAQNLKGHGYAESLENLPYKGGIDK